MPSWNRAFGIKLALLMLPLLGAAIVACSDDEEDARELCRKGCDKFASCSPEFAGFVNTCKSSCESSGNGSGSGQRCSNESAIVAKYKQCLDVACPMFESCIEAVPACQGSGTSGGLGGASGTGGTPGAGGSSGAGGAAGTGGAGGGTAAGCEVCTKADACCAALATMGGGSSDGCTLATTCAGAGSNTAQVVQACQAILETGKATNAAACK